MSDHVVVAFPGLPGVSAEPLGQATSLRPQNLASQPSQTPPSGSSWSPQTPTHFWAPGKSGVVRKRDQ